MLVTHKQWTKMFQAERTKMLVKILIGIFQCLNEFLGNKKHLKKTPK